MQARSSGLIRWASSALLFGLVVAGCESAAPTEDSRTASEDLTSAITLFPTAVNAVGAALAIGSTDPHYAVTATTDTNYPAPPSRNAIVTSKDGGWGTPTAPAAWISLNNHTCSGAPGNTCQSATFDYTTTFTLPAGTHPATATITLTVLADDDVNILLNGTSVGTFPATYAAGSTLTIPAGSTFNANPTVNTLTFHVTNSGGGPTGLAVYTISGSAKGCTLDNQCTALQFCDTQALACTPKIANSAAVPTLTGHAPPLTGVCNAAVGTAVCQATVCDTADNKCGFANGDGPCTIANGPTRCRSLTCDASGLCIPPGGCAVDADCTAAQFCNTATFACVPKIANAGAVPTIAGHTPPLTGACSAAVGTAVCQATVCDTADNKCGFANGDGPCTLANGPTRCRSTACDGVTGVCIPPGGCTLDSECAASTQFCNTATFACTAKVANGTGVPTIGGHTPPLTGVCTALAGAAVCLANVCDTADNACGFANGDGTCNAGNALTVCRSGACGTDLKCGYPNGGGPCAAGTVCRSGVCDVGSGQCIPPGGCVIDSECTATQFCNTQTFTCTPKLGDGTLVPTISGHTPPLTGVCSSVAVGTAVCLATVCDPGDDRCGFANGDGTCNAGSAGTVCRSHVCGTDLVCGYPINEGPCNAGNAGTVCRSGACSVVGVCVPAGGCAADAECGAAQFCNTQTHACTAKIANDNAVPSITGHNPSLTGTCTVVVGAVVCQSGVCDTADNKCGFANGDGPCTAEAGSVCRSAVCDGDGKCGRVDGEACTLPTECRSLMCIAGQCGKMDAGVPDAGPPEDSGAFDAGPVSDGSAPVDGSVPAKVDDGSLEGGGLSCAMGRAPASDFSLGGLLLVIGAIVRRRGRRAV